MDIGELDFFEIELQAFGRVGFLLIFVGIGEIVHEELVVPYRVRALQLDGGVFETDVLQLRFILEEEPVGNIDPHRAGIEQGVMVAVLDQGLLEQHFIKKLEIDVFDADGGVKVMRKPFRHPGYQPGLDGGYMDERPYGNQ